MAVLVHHAVPCKCYASWQFPCSISPGFPHTKVTLSCLQSALARIFGCSGVLFEREAEHSIFEAVAHAGLGPKLLVDNCSIIQLFT